MRKFATLALLFALFTCAPAVPALADWAPAAMNKQIDQTNFLVNDGCSATLIDAENGYLLTANHCITGQFRIVERQRVDSDGTVHTEKVRVAKPGTVSQLFFKGPDETQRNVYTFQVVLNDSNLDLALIKTKAKLPNTQNAPIACDVPRRGETAYAVGNTMAVLYATVSKGIVASVNRNYRMIGVDDQGDNGLLQSTTPIAGGNSGGALYNDRGEIIGVNVRGYQQVAPIALSVPLWDVKKFLMREGLDRLWSRCKAGR